MLVSDFDYALPPTLIAQYPAARRSASRLLRLRADGVLEDLQFADLPELVDARDCLVLNDTRVIKARLAGRKVTGGKVELLIERPLGAHHALALIRASHPPRAGSELLVGDGITATVEERVQDLYRVCFSESLDALLDRCGSLPLPPYIAHDPGEADAERYQTIYAARPGAVAAPTAGLHFDEGIMKKIESRGARIARLTLHVGAGTFQPVRVDQVQAHRMHMERYFIGADVLRSMEGRRVLAVGTTSLRALESYALTGRAEGETDLFIYPGFAFRTVKRLLTNFHLPKSTLLMLACAFAGKERLFEAYRHAVRERYRFFSYGDAMLIET
jgi:S-adenosylmethionine:tRNA ribosyltransferase-isomerase